IITATLNGSSQTFTISATAPVPLMLKSLSCTPATVRNNSTSTCTVALNQPASTGTVVQLQSDNTVVSVPASVIVPVGQSGVSFAAIVGSSNANQNVRVTATFGGQSQSATLNLTTLISCAEFQVSSDGRCMIQDLIPWVVFG